MLALFCPPCYGALVTRDQAVTNGLPYLNVQVTLTTANLISPVLVTPLGLNCDHRYKNLQIELCEGLRIGEFYKWGGADLTTTYQTQVATGSKKVVAGSALDGRGVPSAGKHPIYYQKADFTGVDCSGFVSRALGIGHRDTTGLASVSLPIFYSQMKRGDFFLRWRGFGDNSHVALLREDPAGVVVRLLHATSTRLPNGEPAWRVVDDTTTVSCTAGYCFLTGYTKKGIPQIAEASSAFPQFSSFVPASGEVRGSSRPTVGVTIRSGTTINSASIVLKVDGTTIAAPSIATVGSFLSEVIVSSNLVTDLPDGDHTISIEASNALNLFDTETSEFTVDTSLPEIDPEDPPGKLLPPIVPSSHCVVGVVTSAGSGIRSVTITGPSAFSKTTTFSCVTPSTAVAYGPHCGLPAGEYTITAVSCSSMTKSSTMTVSAVTNTLQIFASSAVGNAASISQYLGLNGEMRVESCVVNMGSDCLWCAQSVYDHTTLQGSGSHSQFCGSHSGGAGNMCCQRLAYSAVGPQEFSIVNLGTGTASYSLSVMAQACKDNCGPNVGAVSSTMTSINAANGGGISGHVEVAQFGKISSQSSGGICTAGSSIGGVTVTTQPCTGILNYLIQKLFPSTKCCVIEGSEVVFTSTMPISFQFEDSAGGVATDTTTLAIYQFDGAVWSSSTITSQVVTKSTTTGVITASGEYLRSGLFGALFHPTDSSAPVTMLSFQGSTFSFLADVFVATSAYIVLTSTDPTVNGYSSQLATTYYRLDATTTSAPFFAYSSSIPAALGFHILEYRALDYAGNYEGIKTSTFLVTAGSLTRTSNRLTSKGRALIGYLDSGAQLEVEARAQDSLTLRVSSPNADSMLSVDNVGLVGLGEMPYGAARLDIQPPGNGEVALGLRSGNSIASTSSVQVAFGYDGSTYMRHALVTTHSTGTVGNRMDFYIWNPLAPSTAAVASMDVLALQVSTNSSGGVMHVRPAGNPVLGVELIVSDGSTLGGGRVIRGAAGPHSSRRLKSDIKDLSAAELSQAARDLRALSHVRYNYRSEPPNAKPHTGVLFEEAPVSIRGPGGTVSLDRRVLNAESSFKEAVLRLEKLQQRLKKLEGGL